MPTDRRHARCGFVLANRRHCSRRGSVTLLAIFVIALVSAMTMGILKRLTVRAQAAHATVASERLFYLEEAAFADAAARLKHNPGFSGRLRWNNNRSGLPDSHLRQSYIVTVQAGTGGDSLVLCEVSMDGITRTSTRTLSGATP